MFLKNNKLGCLITLYIIITLVNVILCDSETVSTTEFVISHGNTIEFTNNYRANRPTIKFSFNGLTIESIDEIQGERSLLAWKLKMSDNSAVRLEISKHLYSSQMEVDWTHSKELCLQYAWNNSFWYNSFQSNKPQWPLNTQTVMKQSTLYQIFKGKVHPDVGFSAHDIFSQLFINSNGFDFWFDHDSILVRRNPHGEKFNEEQQTRQKHSTTLDDNNSNNPVMCLSNNGENFYFAFTSSSNASVLLDNYYDNITFSRKQFGVPNENIFLYPTWKLSDDSMAQNKVIERANEIKKLGFDNSEIYIDNWIHGSLKIDHVAFQNIVEMITQIHKLKFRIGLSIDSIMPGVTINTSNDFLKLKNGTTSSLLDLDNQDAKNKFIYWINNLCVKTKIDLLHTNTKHLDMSPLSNSEQLDYYQKYIEAVSSVDIPVTSFTGINTQHLPVFVRMNSNEMTDVEALQTLIPNVLSISIGGYSFFVPYPIKIDKNEDNKRNEEVFIRLLQAVTLMPSMTFETLPWSISENAVNLTKTFVNLHAQHAETLIALAKLRVKQAIPLIRPMWYAEPDDARTYKINDQFMVGDNIVVAPVVEIGQRERNVYLPSGNWLDQHGKAFVGPGVFKVQAPLEELPYFNRKH